MTPAPSYWSRVFAKARELMDKDKRLDGNTAYWMARNAVDAATGQLQIEVQPCA